MQTEFLFVLAIEMLKCNIGALSRTTKRKQIGEKVVCVRGGGGEEEGGQTKLRNEERWQHN